jgi:hypothetical protein
MDEVYVRLLLFSVMQIYFEIIEDENNQINSSTQARAAITECAAGIWWRVFDLSITEI